MSKKSISELKEYFQAGKRPTESHFGDFIDSYAHLDDPAIFSPFYMHKDFYISFPNQQSDLAVDILFGNDYINGSIEIEIVGTYNHANSVGVLKKRFVIGANPDNWVWYGPASRMVEADGSIVNNIYIGDIIWDSAINQFKLTVYHTNQYGNPYRIRITQYSYADSIAVKNAVLSDVYTKPLIGQNRHFIYFNSKLGIGTSNPENQLHVFRQNSDHQNLTTARFSSDGATGGSNKVTVAYHNEAHLELNSGYSANGYRYGNYFDLNIENDNSQNTNFGAINFVSSQKIQISLRPDGNVGIGTTSPKAKLDILGNIVLGKTHATEGINALSIRYENGSLNNWGSLRSTAESYMSYGVKADNLNGSGWVSSNDTFPNHKMAVTVGDEGVKFLGSGYQQTPTNTSVIMNELMRVSSGGNVGIGTKNPDQKLTVKGKIHAEDVIVDMNVPADYVFQKYYDNYSSIREDYSMMSLNELESFIKENKHLPEIPSGAEMTQDGVTLGDFQMKLLQKIEELTLYMITQNKEIEELKSQLNK